MARTPGQIEARGKSSWRLRVFLCRDEVGKRHYVSRTVKGTRRDAEKALRKMLEEHDSGRLVLPSKATLATFLDEWLAVAIKPRVRASTFSFYRAIVGDYIKPELGPLRLERLTALDIQRWLNTLAERPLKRQPSVKKDEAGQVTPTRAANQVLSARTRRAAFTTLRSALRQAVRWRFLSANPSDEIDAPGRRSRREVKVMTADQATAFLEACRGERLEAFFVLALATGCRPGELAALRWEEDIDLKKGRVSVNRSMARLTGGGVEYGEPKTATGRRTIPLPVSAVLVLREHRQRQREDRVKSGGAWEDEGLVFTGAGGAPLDLKNVLRRDFRRILRKAELPVHYTLYSLRHSAASILIAEGIHVKAVSERLGHTNPGFTMATYVHSMETVQEEAAVTLENVIFGKQKE